MVRFKPWKWASAVHDRLVPYIIAYSFETVAQSSCTVTWI